MTQALQDRLDVGDLFARLSDLLDERRFEDAGTVYHPSVEVHSPRGDLHGLETVITRLSATSPADVRTQHVHGDIQVRVDGDRAEATANQLVYFYRDGEPPHTSAGLRSSSIAVRTADGWRITRMTITRRWQREH